jgi:hypothetical protein
MVGSMIRRRLATPSVILLLVLAALAPREAVADGSPSSRFDTLSRELFERLRSPIDTVLPSRLRQTARALAELPRSELGDDEWLDLHLLLAEADRRLSPAPARAVAAPVSTLRLAEIPSFREVEGADAVEWMDAAARLFRVMEPAGPSASPADLRTGEERARALGEALRGVPAGEDPLASAAREVLAEVAEDLAFDLACRREGLLPAGRESFEWRLEKRHRVPLTSEQARAIGRREWARTIRALEDLAKEEAPGEGWRSLAQRARADRPADVEAYLELCRSATREALEKTLDSGLVRVPEYALEIEVRLAPPSRWIPYAQYRPEGSDDAGVFRGAALFTRPPGSARGPELERWLRDRNRHWMRVICAHEAVPGHHLQFAWASRVKSPMRRLGYNTSYVEGWALYSEELMERAGWFDDPLGRAAWLRMRLWRAERVLLDVGLHVEGMRPSAAARRLRDELGLPADAARAEVRRYLTAPTQPLSYVIGYRRIEALRRAWIASRGPDSEPAFHDRFLALGAVPLDLAAALLLDRRRAYDGAHPWSF